MTLRHDIRHRRGDSFTSKSYAILINGAGVPDLESWDLRAQIRRSFDDPVPIHEWDDEDIVVDTVTLEINGDQIDTDICRLELAGAESADWPITVAEWELQMSKAGEVHTLVEGTFRITRDVTR